ncbi:PREDICTED: neuroguidin isoform X2 [Miniopterus natalensis]|uniref:neuroguidin isoform X2 n=1 Tax=Miniopterus natalensis TaxID=291302 RepID=UPI0007A6B55D|nr:PREDICTED: neuroguidin isoform X2 [Miniopterus natalensis]
MAAPATTEVLESDLPRAVALLKNLQEQVMAVTAQVQALTKKVQARAYPTEKGLSLLEVKDQLLLMYLMDLSHLILDKASGGSLQGHAAVLRLVEIRTVLEKLRPLDQKLKYQIDKLVKTAVTGSLSENDPLRFKPHPSNMMSKLSSEDEEGEAEEGQSGASGKKSANGAVKKYVPPRLVPVHYDETEAEREKKRLERAKRRALSSSVIRELKEQYSDAPEEIRDARHPHVTRQSQEDQHRINYEESMMVRLSVSKREKGRRKRANVMSSQLHSLTHFSDISALTGGTPHLDEDQNPIKKRKKISKKGRKKKGMGSGATDGERREDTKEEARHCQDPKEEGWRGWQSCLAPSQFPAEDGQILLPGLGKGLGCTSPV